MRRALFLCISIVVFVSSCIIDYYNDQLSITNNSGKELSVLYSNEVEASTENNVAAYIADWGTVKPDSTFTIVKPGRENVWHQYIQKGGTKKLYFYIFETDTLRKYKNAYSMRGFVQMNKYFKALSFSEDELKKINWNVVVGK